MELILPWWRHQMETFSVLLALCVGNSPVTGEFPSQRSVTRSLDVFFDLHLNKRLSKQSRCPWFETPSHSWRHCNDKCTFKLILWLDILSTSFEICHRWVPQNPIDKSTLVQVMTWCRQAPSHHLNQCWPRSLMPYGVTKPQWVKSLVRSPVRRMKTLRGWQASLGSAINWLLKSWLLPSMIDCNSQEWHWQPRVITMPTFPSLLALAVVITTTFDAMGILEKYFAREVFCTGPVCSKTLIVQWEKIIQGCRTCTKFVQIILGTAHTGLRMFVIGALVHLSEEVVFIFHRYAIYFSYWTLFVSVGVWFMFPSMAIFTEPLPAMLFHLLSTGMGCSTHKNMWLLGELYD